MREDQAELSRDINPRDLGYAQTINARGVHVLMDMNGHSSLHRLGIFTLHVAPIQLHYFGSVSPLHTRAKPHALHTHVARWPFIEANGMASVGCVWTKPLQPSHSAKRLNLRLSAQRRMR